MLFKWNLRIGIEWVDVWLCGGWVLSGIGNCVVVGMSGVWWLSVVWYVWLIVVGVSWVSVGGWNVSWCLLYGYGSVMYWVCGSSC